MLSSFFAERTAGGGPRQFLTFDPSYNASQPESWPKEKFFTNTAALAAYDFYVEKARCCHPGSIDGYVGQAQLVLDSQLLCLAGCHEEEQHQWPAIR